MSKDTQKLSRLITYTQGAVEKVYTDTMSEAARMLQEEVGDYMSLTSFAVDEYPALNRRIQTSLYNSFEKVYDLAQKSVSKGWRLADNKSNRLTKRIMREAGIDGKLFDGKWAATDEQAIKAFNLRKRGGMNLSQRVWKITKGFESELLNVLQMMVKEGKTPEQINKEVRQYLLHPETIAARIRDEKGRFVGVVYSNQGMGRGVYRSAAKNARRLILTETNMAYRRAMWEKFQKQDFVIGYEISLSPKHDILDICDELVGRYPKEFCWTGWHPLCECGMTPILKTIEEVQRDVASILKGGTSHKSVHKIKALPDNFKRFIKANEQKILSYKTVPFWYQNYLDYLSNKQ